MTGEQTGEHQREEDGADEGEHAAPGQGARVLSPEEARRKRERFLAQAAKQEKVAREEDDDGDSAEPTVATMILPGD